MKKLILIIGLITLFGCDDGSEDACRAEHEEIRVYYIQDVLYAEAINSPDAPALRAEMERLLDNLNCF